jgi:hypothetical protein
MVSGPIAGGSRNDFGDVGQTCVHALGITKYLKPRNRDRRHAGTHIAVRRVRPFALSSQFSSVHQGRRMQPAVTVPWRGGFAAAFVALVASTAVVPIGQAIPPTLTLSLSSSPPTSRDVIAFDMHWSAANHLANVIAQRRYAEIDESIAEMDPWSSPYARWVPAAVDLAVEQINATQNAYARMDMCREMHRFRLAIQQAWPTGAAHMATVDCEVPSGTARSEAGAAGGIENDREQQRADELLHDLDVAAAIAKATLDDDASAMIDACAMIENKPFPQECLQAACRLHEPVLASVIRERAELDAGECGLQPVDLVRVHPDAPAVANERAFVIIDW